MGGRVHDFASGCSPQNQVVHVADLVEQATRRQEHRRLCLGFSRFLLSCATPCKCSCGDKGSYVWHNYKPLTEKLEDFIESVLGAYVDRDSVVVAAAHVLRRFMLARNAPVCRDMTLRLVAVAVCVSAKYWDEGASFRRNNAQIASRAGIALEDFNRMEIHLLRELGWTVMISREEYDDMLARLELLGDVTGGDKEDAASRATGLSNGVAGLRTISPSLSTDMVEMLQRDCTSVIMSGPSGSQAAACVPEHSTVEESRTAVGDAPRVARGEEAAVCVPDFCRESAGDVLASAAKDSEGNLFMTRLVFAEIPQKAHDSSFSETPPSTCDLGSNAEKGETILRTESFDLLLARD